MIRETAFFPSGKDPRRLFFGTGKLRHGQNDWLVVEDADADHAAPGTMTSILIQARANDNTVISIHNNKEVDSLACATRPAVRPTLACFIDLVHIHYSTFAIAFEHTFAVSR